jgi:hypothetical protein
MRCLAALGCVLLGYLPLPALAEAPRDRVWHGTVYVGQWISSRLLDVPRRLGTGNVEMKDITFASLIANHVVVPELRTGWPVLGPVIDGGSIEVEAQFGQQFGRQRHQEATLALVWRSREITLPATRASINLAIGEGLSYTLSRPTFEGLENDQQPRKFLNYLAFEAEVSHPALPGISLVPRLHHRSGIFGLIAPQGTGSNILGLGLRITLQ